jgi:alpha-galactosidase
VRARLSGPDGWGVQATSPTGIDELAAGKSLATTWRVQVPADVQPGTYSLDLEASFHTEADPSTVTSRQTLRVVVPIPLPSGTSYLSDDNWLSAVNGYGPVERNTSNGESKAGDGHTMTINGATYAKGIGAHAPGVIEFYLGGRCSTVTSDVGVDDEKSANGSVTFEIWADGTKVADSGLMTVADPAKTLTANVSGATLLRLVVTDGGNGNNSDHADWAGAQVTCT